jgi:hypothetical protein
MNEQQVQVQLCLTSHLQPTLLAAPTIVPTDRHVSSAGQHRYMPVRTFGVRMIQPLPIKVTCLPA